MRHERRGLCCVPESESESVCEAEDAVGAADSAVGVGLTRIRYLHKTTEFSVSLSLKQSIENSRREVALYCRYCEAPAGHFC